MEICKYCGALSDTTFCGNCGARIKPKEDNDNKEDIDNSEQPIDPVFGFKMFSFNPEDIIKKAQEFKKICEEHPLETSNKDIGYLYARVIDDMINGPSNRIPKKQKPGVKDKNTSRLCIINGMCPNCMHEFKTGDLQCRKCLTSLNVDDYK